MNDMSRPVPAPALIAVPDPKRWTALIVLLTGAFLPAFDFFVVNVALPAIHTELGAGPAAMELVVAGYGLAFAILLITGGRLGDLFGRKRMFIVGMIGFTIASALCGAATSPGVLIASRILQGLTAALMNPQVLAIIRVTFPENERAKAIGYFGTTLGLASILAQLIGGALIQANIAGLGWRPIFLVNVPVGAVALLFARSTLQESKAAGRPSLDFGGIVLATLTLTLLVYPLVEGDSLGWPWWTHVMLALSLPSLAAFTLYEWTLQARNRAPLVPMRLFRDPAFSLGLVMVMTFFSGLAAFFMGLTIFLQQGFGYGPLATGLVFVAFGIGFVGSSLVSSQVSRRIGPRTISLGSTMMATGLLAIVAMAHAAHGSPLNLLVLWPVLVWYGCGQGLALPTLVASVVGSSRIPPQEAGAASGVFTMMQQVSFALGVAIIMGLFFAILGNSTAPSVYEHALSTALSCNAALLFLTCLLAFFLPRRPPVAGVVVHVE
jgi:EmrB/QacA subfamily drug resistance transporter